jgi:tRNA threonylcarbamoyl adenosine modification protein YeaZ
VKGRGGGAPPDVPLLAIDTATSVAVVALGTRGGELVAADAWDAGHRHAEELLGRIAGLLAAAGLGRPRPGSIAGVIVGTGPGGFTGLRVGMATARGLARASGSPLVGIPSGAALAAAARTAAGLKPEADVDVLIPAGPAGRYLVRGGHAVLLLADERDPGALATAGAGEAARGLLVAVDLHGRAAEPAVVLGDAAQAGLAAALVDLGAARLRAGEDDRDTLVPEYVTMPRGMTAAGGEVAWSPARP